MDNSKITIIKFLELTLTIIICILHSDSIAVGDSTGVMITTGTYFGYVIILVGIFIGLCTGVPITAQLDMYFALVGAVLYIALGLRSYNSTKAWLSIANGVVFAVDAFFIYSG